MAKLIELDVKEQAASHSQDQCSVQENQPGLANVCVVEEHETSSDNTGGQAVSGLPHDQVGDGDGQGTEKRWQGSKGQVRHLVCDIRVANVLEVEVSIVSN